MHNILVVDDVETDRLLVGAVIESAGHRALYASTGAEALEKAKSMSPSLIFLDVVMPVQDGFKTTRELKRDPATARIPVVLVTSKGTDSDRFWGRRQGADDHVVKPFAKETLIDLIRRFAR